MFQTLHHLHQAGTAEAPQRGYTLGHFDTLRVRFVRNAVTAATGERQGPIQDSLYPSPPKKEGGQNIVVHNNKGDGQKRRFTAFCILHDIR